MMNVGVEGTYSFEVIEREICTTVNSFFLYHQEKYFIEFRYNVNISFLDKNFDSKGKIRVEPFEDDTEKMFFCTGNHSKEEEVYLYLAELLENRSDYLMGLFKDRFEYDIRKYIQENNLKALKEKIKANNSFEINMSFEIEKP